MSSCLGCEWEIGERRIPNLPAFAIQECGSRGKGRDSQPLSLGSVLVMLIPNTQAVSTSLTRDFTGQHCSFGIWSVFKEAADLSSKSLGVVVGLFQTKHFCLPPFV